MVGKNMHELYKNPGGGVGVRKTFMAKFLFRCVKISRIS
jgi:hypothetical protein